jgi:transcriptional regulator with XRE-family HTH domain
MPARTQRPFAEELPRLLGERKLSLRAVARESELSHGFLSRILRERDDKRASPEVARRVAKALDLPEDFFVEAREGFIIDVMKGDPGLREELYDRLRRRRPQKKRVTGAG